MSRMQPINVQKSKRSDSQSKKKKVELDLPEILEGELRKEAEDECRTLEQHMIYILKNRFRVIREIQTVPSIATTYDLIYRGNQCPRDTWEIGSAGGSCLSVTNVTC